MLELWKVGTGADGVKNATGAVSLRILPLLLMSILLTAPILAQRVASVSTTDLVPEDPWFEHVTIADGLSSGNVTSILQDRTGFMWFGTFQGLNRYDGKRFKIFRHDPQDPDGLSNRVVRAILEDRNGNLWICTDGGGLNLFDPETETFTHYRHDPAVPESLSDNQLWCILEAPNGLLWIGTQNGGLNRFDPSTGSSVHYRHDPNDPESLASDYIEDLWLDRTGLLWIACRGGGLNRMDPETGQCVRYLHQNDNPKSLVSNDLVSLFQDRTGNIWIGTQIGLDYLNPATGEITHCPHLNGRTVFSIFEDSPGTLWFGSDFGVSTFDPEQEEWRDFRHDAMTPLSLAEGPVTSIYEDQAGLVWVGTGGAGLSYLDPSEAQTTRFRVYESAGQERPNIGGFAETSDGSIWLATSLGLQNFNLRTGEVRFVDLGSSQSRLSQHVRLVLLDSDDSLWIGTLSGVKRFEPLTGKITNVGDPGVLSMVEGQSGELWMGLYPQGLRRIDPETGETTDYPSRPNQTEEMKDWQVGALLLDRSGDVWIGTRFHGLYSYDSKSEEFSFHPEYVQGVGASSLARIYTLYEDPSGVLWVGTDQGLCRQKKQDGSFVCYGEEDGFSGEIVLGIVADIRDDTLWLGSNAGLIRFDISKETFRTFDESDGFFRPTQSVYLSRGGRLIVGGRGAVAIASPGQIRDNNYVPPVVLAELKINYRPVEIGSRTLQEAAWNTDSIMLTHDDRLVEFEFAALSYQGSRNNLFQYKLEGFDEEWSPVSSDGHTFFRNLPPGDYNFRVRASNEDGVWNEEGVSLAVKVLPPWWGTLWFRGVFLILVLGVAVGAFRFRVHAIRAQKSRLEVQVAEKTEALDSINRDLEQRVEDRTQRVNQANRELNTEVAERRRAENEVRRSLEFERLVSKLSSEFINLPADRIDSRIKEALKLVCLTLGFDRSLVHEFSPDGAKLSVTNYYVGPGLEKPPKALTSAAQPFFTKAMLEDRVVNFESIGDLPKEAELEKSYLTKQGVKSGLAIPLVVGKKPMGALTLTSISGERSWSAGLIGRLQLIGEILGNALERKQKEAELRIALSEVRSLKGKVEDENVYLREELKATLQYDEIIGTSQVLQEVLKAAEQVAGTASTVLITGETGTGKELIARLIHNLSSRSNRPMIKVNCAALPSTLVESELFGREKGAYTGAVTRQAGRFELADRSTIFLDEIGELPSELQAKLLRVLEEHEFERLGSPRTIKVDVRVIAATNRDLEQKIKGGNFREDLFYRLSSFPIEVPPLRARREDIPSLVWHFIRQVSGTYRKEIKTIRKSQMLRLQGYSWPGNIRELKNVIERAAIRATGTTLEVQLPTGSSSRADNEILSLEAAEKRHIIAALELTDWRVSGEVGAAKLLEINPKTLFSRMKKLGIQKEN